jgi:hypothetical protein
VTRFGVLLPQHHSSKDELFQAARLAEGSGLDSIWLADHVFGRPDPDRPILEGWMALSAVAAITERITVGPMVARVTLRLPRVLAAMVETLERIVPSRLVAALGIADSTVVEEQASYGIPFPPKAERLQLLDETIRWIRQVSPQTTIWIGGTTAELLDRADQVDGFNFWVEPQEFEALAGKLKGRDGLELSWSGNMPNQEQVDQVVEAGARHIIVPVGVKNYRERIAFLADERSRLAK